VSAPPPVAGASWLASRAEVRPSPIAGRGLFATAPIAAGEVVLKFGGRLIDDAQLAALQPPYSSLAVADGWHLLLDPDHPACFANHACDPNLWLRDATTATARRDIGEGAELTLDYATLTGVETWTMDCACGAQACRGRVTGADWRRPDLQRAYGAHWTPPLLAKIRTPAPGA
jgi:SET domain-containing protein